MRPNDTPAAGDTARHTRARGTPARTGRRAAHL